jgi:RNA polymerase sigma-70 factor, ECF subfamily
MDFSDDGALVTALRSGDEAAFTWLLEQYDAPLHRTARMYVATDAQADEVVQETWMAVLRGIDRFEQRSSLKTWLYRILMNIARTHGVRESRTVPFSPVAGATVDGAEPTVDPDRFRPPGDPDWPGHWATFRSTGSTSPRHGSSPTRRSCWWRGSSRRCRPHNARCSPCAMSRAGRRWRSVTPSG